MVATSWVTRIQRTSVCQSAELRENTPHTGAESEEGKGHSRGLCQLKTQNCGNLQRERMGKERGKRRESTGRGEDGRERQRQRESRFMQKKSWEALPPKEIFFTEIRPFQTAPKVIVYIYWPLPKSQILHIFPGEDSLWSPTWGRYKPGCGLRLQSFPKKCFIFNLNVNVLYNLMPWATLFSRTVKWNAFHIHFPFISGFSWRPFRSQLKLRGICPKDPTQHHHLGSCRIPAEFAIGSLQIFLKWKNNNPSYLNSVSLYLSDVFYTEFYITLNKAL